ncbi:hypothetical protein ROZALSC1DRAFT_24593 [Rozella allomycis CSF55]|uniref:Uncharacterized protein n=1 Tax=Rozella allomycis (strain CSF55) TaxID=988480 RepID=A0A4P9YCG5_ROZAC|nr:hypothetical protein ROZALSC1DRAFT_24593 [Rozella allomycis CSF55]
MFIYCFSYSFDFRSPVFLPDEAITAQIEGLVLEENFSNIFHARKERYHNTDKDFMHAITDGIINVSLSLNEVNKGVTFIDDGNTTVFVMTEFKKDVDAVAANMRNLFASKLSDVSSKVI